MVRGRALEHVVQQRRRQRELVGFVGEAQAAGLAQIERARKVILEVQGGGMLDQAHVGRVVERLFVVLKSGDRLRGLGVERGVETVVAQFVEREIAVVDRAGRGAIIIVFGKDAGKLIGAHLARGG